MKLCFGTLGTMNVIKRAQEDNGPFGVFWSQCEPKYNNSATLPASSLESSFFSLKMQQYEICSKLEDFQVLGCGPSGPSGLLDNVLHALRALRPCDPRNSAMMG